MGFNLGGFAGGLASGYVAGARLKGDQDERKWQEEQRGRQRKQWESEDAVGKAFSDAMSGGAGLESVSPQQNMSPDPERAGTVPDLPAAPQMSVAPKQPGSDSELSREQRILRASNAAMEEAAKRGDMQLFSRHFNSATEVRATLRARALDNADRQFAMSGDWNAYVPAYNDFVADGNKINGIQKQADGSYLLSASGPDGRQIQRPVKNEQALKALVQTMTDPAAMRKLEAAKAIKEFEILAEQSKAVATEEAKARAKATYDPSTVKRSRGEGEGEDVGVVVPDGKGGASINWQGGGLDSAGPRPLSDKTANNVRHAVESIYKSNGMNVMLPETQAKVSKSMAMASSLIQSNKGSENAAFLDVNTAAKIASDIADGTLKEQKFADKDGRVWRGVEWNGRKLLLDLQPGAAETSPGGKAASQPKGDANGTRSAGGKIRSMTVEPATQAARDKDAGRLMVSEFGSEDAARSGLAELDKEIARAKDPTARKVLEGERSRLVAGLSSKEGTAPAAAIEHLKKNPGLASQFKQKYGYLPEGS